MGKLIDKCINFPNSASRKVKTQYELHFSPRPVTKVYGLLRTGTNYLSRLLELNFDTYCLKSEEMGWKHGPCVYTEKLRFIFIVKSPYSWLNSFREWEIIHNRVPESISVEEFILRDISHPQLNDAWIASTPLEAWNESLRSWCQYFDKNNVALVRYEDLIKDFDTSMSRVRHELKLNMRFTEFRNYSERADNWSTPKPRKKLDKGRYLFGSLVDSYSERELELFRQRLDPKVAEAFQYQIY